MKQPKYTRYTQQLKSRSKISRSRFDVALNDRRARQFGEGKVPPRTKIALILAAAAGLVALFAVRWVTSDAWRVNAIHVVNNKGVPVAQIIGASALLGEHTQTVDLNAAAKRIDDLPGIQAAQVTCGWQGACEVLVQESQPLAVWQSALGSVWVDDEGKVQRLDAKSQLSAPLTIKVESGEPPSTEADLDERMMRALTELQQLQPKVTSYGYSAEYGLSFVDDRNMRVRVGLSERVGAMAHKLEVAKALSAQLASAGTPARLLDVRFPEAPFYSK